MQKKFVRGALLGGGVSAILVIGSAFVYQKSIVVKSENDRSPSAVADGELPALPVAGSTTALAASTSKPPATDRALSNLPEAMPTIKKRSKINLWDENTRFGQTEVNGIPTLHLRVNPQVLEEFHVGQQVDFAIPQSGNNLSSKITSTHNQMGGVKVWKATIKNGHPMDNMIVTQGKIETHVIVSTKAGTYSAIIDNKTGQTTLVDEGEIAARSLPIEDGIPADPINDNPPLS